MALFERIDALSNDGKPGLQWSDFKGVADKAIRNAAKDENLTGAQKMKQVRKAVIKAMDKAIEPEEAWAEALSDAGIRALVGAATMFIQDRFDKMRARGDV